MKDQPFQEYALHLLLLDFNNDANVNILFYQSNFSHETLCIIVPIYPHILAPEGVQRTE